ncbi:hypothetical protein D623_10031234 [Myotis brandtii]|uniref:Uncharacterized protein n=1 Tax=Myotis brandtii TaxID=109478 RepID=S7N7M8_MYOBR|nr:hypothetical protein D623_10031234 [Myotis brandtii]
MSKRSPTKGRLGWVPARQVPALLPKDPAFLYRDGKIRELLPDRTVESILIYALSSQILHTLASAGKGQASTHLPILGWRRGSAASHQRAGQLQGHL